MLYAVSTKFQFAFRKQVRTDYQKKKKKNYIKIVYLFKWKRIKILSCSQDFFFAFIYTI